MPVSAGSSPRHEDEREVEPAGRHAAAEARPGSSRPRSPGSPARASGRRRTRPGGRPAATAPRARRRRSCPGRCPARTSRRARWRTRRTGSSRPGRGSPRAGVSPENGSTGFPVARSAATTAKLFSWSSSNGTRRMIPPGSSSKFPFPTLVRAYSIPSAPPRKFGSPVLAHLGGREDDVAGRAGSVHEGVVLLGVRRGLAELDVVRDHLRPVRLQPRDHPAVIRARKRPLQVRARRR